MASPNISFEQIRSSTRKPGKYFEFNTKLAKRSLSTNLQKVLLVGQRLESGTQPANVPVDVFSDREAAELFGYGSIAHRMVAHAITANPYAALTVVAVDDAPAGQPAKGTVKLTGTAAGAGALACYIGQDRVDIAIDAAATGTEVSAALAAIINQTRELPVTASAEDGTVTITAKHKGAAGNMIKLRTVRDLADGIEIVITDMAAGLNDPTLDDAFAAVFGAWYQVYAIPFATEAALLALRRQMESVGHALEQRDAVGVAGWPGTLAGATTMAASINSGFITYGWHNKSRCSAAELAAGYAAVVAGEEDPAMPLNTLEIAGLDVTPPEDRPGRVEQENALHNGVTPLEVGPGGRVQIVRAITTYLVDPQAVEDDSMLDLTTIRTMQFVRKACRERIALRYPRAKNSRRMPAKVRSELLDVLMQCEELEILEDIQEHANALIVERDSQSRGQLNAAIPAPVVPGLHVFAGRIDLYL